MRIVLTIIFFAALASGRGFAQTLGEFLGDEGVFYAETKQLNQFFRRFNSEEDPNGERLYAGHPNFRLKSDRVKYIQMLFDRENRNISEGIKREFIDYVTEGETATFLEFHAGEWFAEVETRFLYKGKAHQITLFLKIQKEPIGSKWVLTNIFFEPFRKLFVADTTELKFLHPMSHELEFMNLNKAFRVNEELELYAQREYKPDYLSLMFYEMKLGNLVFETVKSVKFHFFQVNNWYFEISRFNRAGYNSGWLISNLVKINKDEKSLLLKHIFYEGD
jgi:hypothetical protein